MIETSCFGDSFSLFNGLFFKSTQRKNDITGELREIKKIFLVVQTGESFLVVPAVRKIKTDPSSSPCRCCVKYVYYQKNVLFFFLRMF